MLARGSTGASASAALLSGGGGGGFSKDGGRGSYSSLRSMNAAETAIRNDAATMIAMFVVEYECALSHMPFGSSVAESGSPVSNA